MDKNFEEYIKLSKEIEVLETQKEVIREKIQLELPAEGFKNDFVNAIWKSKKTWKYSSKIDDLSLGLKTAKKAEEDSGVASVEEVKQLAITVK